MARIRANLVAGNLSDAALTASTSAQTMNAAGLASLPAVNSPDVAAITLDPKGAAGPAEIVVVTAHAAGATTATVTRGGEGTAVRAHVSGEYWSHDPTAQDFQDILPPGCLQMFAMATPVPAGWLLCNGQAVSRTTYAALWTILGTTYGAGDGSTTFNVPDLRDRLPLGANARALASSGGSLSHTHAPDTVGTHSHTGVTGTDNQSHVHGGVTAGAAQTFGIASGHTHNVSAGTPGTGNSGGSDPPYLAVNFIIKT